MKVFCPAMQEILVIQCPVFQTNGLTVVWEAACLACGERNQIIPITVLINLQHIGRGLHCRASNVKLLRHGWGLNETFHLQSCVAYFMGNLICWKTTQNICTVHLLQIAPLFYFYSRIFEFQEFKTSQLEFQVSLFFWGKPDVWPYQNAFFFTSHSTLPEAVIFL